MKFTEIKDFDLTDDFFSGVGYLNSSIIEIFDRLGVLDLMRNIYVDKALANKVDMLTCLCDFGDLFDSVAYEVCNTITITDIWELCSVYTIDKCVSCSEANDIKHIDNIITVMIKETLFELLCYSPVANFLSKELALYIYKHTHDNIAQFPFATISSYIKKSTYIEDSVQEFIDFVKKAE